MRWFIIPAVLAAGLTFMAPASAKAQVIVGGYPAYYNGYSPYSGGLSTGSGGLVQLGLNLALRALGAGGYGYYPGNYGGYYPGYSGGYYGNYFPSFYGGLGGYGYRPYGYRPYGYTNYYRGWNGGGRGYVYHGNRGGGRGHRRH